MGLGAEFITLTFLFLYSLNAVTFLNVISGYIVAE